MEVENGDQKQKKTSMLKKLERYLSTKRRVKPSTCVFTKSKSRHSSRGKKPPIGCFSVYVGPEKQRFVIKTELANHPLFKMLLEDAELEYGFNTEGPLRLPCEVGLFCKVLAEMDGCDELDHEYPCGFGHGSCSPFSPARRLGKSDMARGCGSFGLLTPPRLLKINSHF